MNLAEIKNIQKIEDFENATPPKKFHKVLIITLSVYAVVFLGAYLPIYFNNESIITKNRKAYAEKKKKQNELEARQAKEESIRIQTKQLALSKVSKQIDTHIAKQEYEKALTLYGQNTDQLSSTGLAINKESEIIILLLNNFDQNMQKLMANGTPSFLFGMLDGQRHGGTPRFYGFVNQYARKSKNARVWKKEIYNDTKWNNLMRTLPSNFLSHFKMKVRSWKKANEY